MKRFILPLLFFALGVINEANGHGWNIDSVSTMFCNLDMAKDIAICPSGNFACVATRVTGVRMMDISDPAQIIEVGWYQPSDYINCTAVLGDRAFVVTEAFDGTAYFRTLDISNQDSLVLIGTTPINWLGASHLAVSGNYVYAAAMFNGLRIMDISAQEPVEAGFVQGFWNARCVAVSGNYAYVGCDYSLQVIDVTDPDNPQSVAEMPVTGSAGPMTGMVISGNYAYITDGSHGVLTVQISNPLRPRLVSSFTGGLSLVSAVALFSDSLILVTGESASSPGIYTINVSDTSNTYVVGSCPLPGTYGWDLAVNGGVAYVADSEYGICGVNVANPQAPQLIGSYHTPGYILQVALSNNFAYLACYDAGVKKVNMEDPTNPFVADSCVVPGNCISIAVADNSVVAALADSGIAVLNTTLTGDLEINGRSSGFYAQDIAVSDSIAVVAGGPEANIRLFNISDPANPQQIGLLETIPVLGYAYGIALSGNYVYLANGELGLVVVDVSDPSNPTLVNPMMPGMTFAVAAVNDSIVCTSVVAGLNLYNVSDPSAPVGIGTVVLDAICTDITVVGQYMYCAVSTSINVYCLETPAEPLLVGTYDTQGVPNGIAAFGDYVYVADTYNFGIYNCSAALPVKPIPEPEPPKTFALQQNYPNPFNPTTTISYQLPTGSHVKLDVFDTSGRLVSTLVNGWRSLGNQTVTFNGSHLSSGTYIYRLTAGTNTAAGKMVLLK